VTEFVGEMAKPKVTLAALTERSSRLEGPARDGS
jgi:hypothetical protein